MQQNFELVFLYIEGHSLKIACDEFLKSRQINRVLLASSKDRSIQEQHLH